MYLGSRSTFVLGQFGGHAGRILRTGDMLRDQQPAACLLHDRSHPRLSRALPAGETIPRYFRTWEIAVLYGPTGAPDYSTLEAMDAFFAADWEVHYNSNRLGVRLIGPKPDWARSSGGEAGLHRRMCMTVSTRWAALTSRAIVPSSSPDGPASAASLSA